MNALAIDETATASAECRIYVACLASYNNGVLHGEWVDVDGKDGDDLQQEINERILRTSRFPNVTRAQCKACDHIQDFAEDDTCDECVGDLGEPFPSAEEWAIHDHEGFGKLIGEYTPLEEVAALAEVLSDDDQDKRRGLFWLIEDRGFKVSEAIDRCDEVRTFDGTPQEYAESYVDECYTEDQLGPLSAYIDYERFARDMVIGGDIDEAEVGGERFIVTNANEF